MKTIELYCFERLLTVKYLIACSTEQLLVFNNSAILLGAPGKTLDKTLPTPRKVPPFGPPPPPLSLEFLLPSMVVVVVGEGGGMDIFWNYRI